MFFKPINNSINRRLIIVFCLLPLAGCMGGKMAGVMTDKQAVTMNYSQGMSSDTYSTIIDGEFFEGRAVLVDASTTFSSAFGSAYSAYGSSAISTSGHSFSSTGRVKAILLGNRGSSLKCLMNYADPSGFTTSGGVGECVHSDGRQIAFVW